MTDQWEAKYWQSESYFYHPAYNPLGSWEKSPYDLALIKQEESFKMVADSFQAAYLNMCYLNKHRPSQFNILTVIGLGRHNPNPG